MINKDFIFRVLKTFAQAVISALVVELAAGVDFTNREAVKTLIVGIVAAGLSAVMNIKKAVSEPIEVDEGEDK